MASPMPPSYRESVWEEARMSAERMTAACSCDLYTVNCERRHATAASVQTAKCKVILNIAFPVVYKCTHRS